MAGSPLTDGSAFAAKMEAAYRKIWTAWCEQGGKKG
jgi:predicted O-linked N-acetylglucosamine transferase (SPINDLY family)